MQLTHYLSHQSIIIPLHGATKHEVLDELVDRVSDKLGIENKERLLDVIEEREECASTFLPMGVAVPHARVPEVQDITMVVGVARNAIADTWGDNPLKANIFCLFLSPTEEKEFGNHLKLLARIAAVFSDPNFVNELSQVDSCDEFFSRIQGRERQIENQ